MKHQPLLTTLALFVVSIAVFVAVYRGDHASQYLASLDTPAWMDMSNTTADLRSVLKRMGSNVDIQNLQSPLNSLFYSSFKYANDPTRVSLKLAEKGVKAKYPVVIIPGFVTSGLELWHGLSCFQGHFRARLWTKYTMAGMFLSNRQCWMKHLSLDFSSGLDPEGIRVRNAQGLDAVDFFFPGYDVWAKAIVSLADIGYDSSTMVALPYDWRLSIPNLELRDGYFTRLRSQIEFFRRVYDQKVLIVAHSWGDNVARNFLYWMEEISPRWVEEHVAVHFNAAGPVLGVPKALTSLLSGELKETAQLLGLASVIGEQLLGKEERTLVWRTWGSALGMLPSGGTRIWGNTTWAADDITSNKTAGTFGVMLSVLEQQDTEEPELRELDAVSGVAEIVKDAGPMYLHHVKHWSAAELPHNITEMLEYRFGQGEEELLAAVQKPWDGPTARSQATSERSGQRLQPQHARRASVPHYDPLATPLPAAPGLRLYCGYGHGIATERAYHYRHSPVLCEEEQCPAGMLETDLSNTQIAAGKAWNINQEANNSTRAQEHGVVFGDGDGTVPLVSLGYACAGPWRTPKLNPGGVKVVLREYEDASKITMSDPRGGPLASAHVEVLGNRDFLTDLLHAAAGWHEEVDTDAVQSPIRDITARIDGG
eukprot:jgi/Ulvmu1/437/UM001_0444.1